MSQHNFNKNKMQYIIFKCDYSFHNVSCSRSVIRKNYRSLTSNKYKFIYVVKSKREQYQTKFQYEF